MTLAEILHSNHGYDETLVVDKNGKELMSWQDNDPKYLANVICTEPIENNTVLKVTINFKEEK